jgi:DNA-binding transcriptional LysR family regulator
MDRLDCDRMFVAIMETGSFAKAAERLGTSSGQASKLVSHLERLLGSRLLNRTTRALSATEIGRAYFERIRGLLGDLDALDQSVRSHSGVAAGRLRLTAPMSFGALQLAPALLAFAEAYGEIELDVSFTDRVVNLVEEGFDAGVRIGNPSDSTLIARRLCEVRVVLAASASFLALKGEPETPADLSDHACIVDTNFPEPGVWRFRDPESGLPVTVQVNSRLRFSSADVCLAAAEAGLGITRVPSFMAGPMFQAGRLVPVLARFEAPAPGGVHVIYPTSRHLALKVRALVDFLAERFRGTPTWDEGW